MVVQNQQSSQQPSASYRPGQLVVREIEGTEFLAVVLSEKIESSGIVYDICYTDDENIELRVDSSEMEAALEGGGNFSLPYTLPSGGKVIDTEWIDAKLAIAQDRAQGKFDIKLSPRYRPDTPDSSDVDVKPTGTVEIDGKFYGPDGSVIISHVDEEIARQKGVEEAPAGVCGGGIRGIRALRKDK